MQRMENVSAAAKRLQCYRAAATYLATHPEWATRLATLERHLPGGNARRVDLAAKGELRLSGEADFVIEGAALARCGNAIVLDNCRRFRLRNLASSDLAGCAIVLFDCEDFEISDITCRRAYSSSITLVGDTRYGRITRVRTTESLGPRNRDAGLNFVNCSPAVTLADVPDQCHEPLSIMQKSKRPAFMELDDVHSTRNRAQGIYLEGAFGISMKRIRLARNAKEGICFDWGTAFSTLSRSVIKWNGWRHAISPEEVQADFLHNIPILPDGSSAVKVPGVSFDNAAFNRIVGCYISRNGGGAVKHIRASVGTLTALNLCVFNTGGNNAFARTSWYGDLGLDDVLGEFDHEAPPLSLGPSYHLKRRYNLPVEPSLLRSERAERLLYRLMPGRS
ncbi:right-handed parallel beta-helix repeat-containing protein [Ciceribacter sp. RN22]|uniref:right-handed parallel beta-helix repeat-containing protein n=1 Tax=Ciceribacter sp. RN22 TaxID=2954932 RepID=UPI0020931318|nr:right-handed parallel beta-helix repeat-containing protein [Ciceribacter sp. RN22]MCO6181047.1 right-handed parallel beta-helix repeat-containing protein [Ciceribacter sp. RN22]